MPKKTKEPKKDMEDSDIKQNSDPLTQDSESQYEFDNFQEIGDYITYNPLADFIYIDKKAYAIRSVVVLITVTATNKKGNSSIEPKQVWRTEYVDDNGQCQLLRKNRINGRYVRPLFSAEDFMDALQNYGGLLKHRNRVNRKPMDAQVITKVLHWTENAIKSMLSISDDDLKLMSCWIIASHFHRVFNQFPPLIFGKPGSNAGGTVALVASSLAPFPVSIFEPTEATLFRLAQMGLTLLIDEIDPNQRDKISILNLILDGSFSKDAYIPRATGKNFSVEGFSPYGPKVCIDPYMAEVKPSTLSRSIRLFLVKDPKRSEKPNMGQFIDKYRYLVDYLYDLFLPYAHKVRKAYDETKDFSGRELQAYAPVLAIAELTGCKEQVKRALGGSIRNLEIHKEGDPVKFVLKSLYEYFLEVRSDNTDFSDVFSQDRDKSHYYVQLSKLAETIRRRVQEIHQTDESKTYDKEGVPHTNKRDWKKIPSEFKQILEGTKFSGVVNDNLGKWIGNVRGNRKGLRLDANPKKGKPLDPILDELEKILGIDTLQSFRQENTEDLDKDHEEETKSPKDELDNIL